MATWADSRTWNQRRAPRNAQNPTPYEGLRASRLPQGVDLTLQPAGGVEGQALAQQWKNEGWVNPATLNENERYAPGSVWNGAAGQYMNPLDSYNYGQGPGGDPTIVPGGTPTGTQLQTNPITGGVTPYGQEMFLPQTNGYGQNGVTMPTMPGAPSADPFAAFRTEQLDPNRAFITGAGISELMNPYLQQVRDQTMSDIERQRQLSQMNTDDAAGRARAFGGDRHGVANALTNDAFARAAAQQYAGLNAQGFNTAAGLAGQNAQNYLAGRGQDIGQNMGFMGGALQQRGQDIGYGLGQAGLQLQQRGQDIGYNLGQTANQLNAYQTAGSLLNQSGLMDWLSINQGANATGSLPSNQTSTQQDGGSNWNNIIGGLFTGLGLLRG